MKGKLSLLAFLTVAATFPSCGGRAVDMGGAGQGTGGDAGPASGGTGGTGGSHSSGGTGGSHSSGGTGGSHSTGGTGGIGGTSGIGGAAGGYPGGTSGTGAYPGGGGSGAVSSGGGYGGDIQQTCGGAVCAANEICCYTSGQCFDPATSPNACATSQQQGCGPMGTACASDADCDSDSYCKPELGCMNPGCCTSKLLCGGMSVTSCGCDGQSLDYHWACTAGIPAIDWSCGTTFSNGGSVLTACGNTSAWCPGSQQCCPITGTCYDPSKPQLCVVPPAGTYFPCIQDSDCPRAGDFCVGPTCGAPGGCVHQAAHDDCTGQWDPVCGCDGHTYVNAICAQASSMAVAHKGECSDAGM